MDDLELKPHSVTPLSMEWSWLEKPFMSSSIAEIVDLRMCRKRVGPQPVLTEMADSLRADESSLSNMRLLPGPLPEGGQNKRVDLKAKSSADAPSITRYRYRQHHDRRWSD